MSTVTSLGLAFVPTLPPEALPDVARACDAHLDELWLWEDCFKESGLVTSAVVLASTTRLRVGLGLMPAPLRNVALTAMEVATLHRLFPGRFLPGVGHGVQDWMAQVGGRVASPLTLLEEYAVALRRLLDGEEVTTSGRYVRLDRVRLHWPPEPGTPLWLGGTGPRTLRLSGRLGDGVLLPGGLSEQAAAAMRAEVAAGWSDTHEGGTAPLMHQLIAATGPGATERIAGELERWAIAPEPGVAVAGDAAAIAETIRGLAESGVTNLVVQPTEDEPDLLGLIALLGEQVRPLLG